MTKGVSSQYVVKFDSLDMTHHPEYRSECMKGARLSGTDTYNIVLNWPDLFFFKNIMSRTKMFECGRMFPSL